MKMHKFYGYYSAGYEALTGEKNFFSIKYLNHVKKEISYNCKRLGLNNNSLLDKTIMVVGSGREAFGFLKFNPKKIYHYDISKKNISTMKNIINQKKLSNKIISTRLDLSINQLPKNKFDLVYMHGIIQHVDHVDKAIKNISKSMKKNSKLWFYFYRPGSLAIFLASVQRYLLQKTNIRNFQLKLNRTNHTFKFKDNLLDDSFVPNFQLFYPKDYIARLKKLNLNIYGDSFLVNTSQKVNFNKFHSSVILFLKKTTDKNSISSKEFLTPNRSVDVLDPKIYKNNKTLSKITKLLKKINVSETKNIFEKVIMIEKLKLHIFKTFFKNKKINNIYISEVLNKVIKIIL